MAITDSIIAPPNWSQDATVTVSSENTNYPKENILRTQPRDTFRALSGVTNVQIDLTTPGAVERDFDTVAVLFANVQGISAVWTIRASLDAGDIDTGPWTVNETSLQFWASTGLDNFDRTHAFWRSTTGMRRASKIRIIISYSALPDNYLSVGNVVVSESWQPTIGLQYGSGLWGLTDFGSLDQGIPGVTFPTRGGVARSLPVTFQVNDKTEAVDLQYLIETQLGSTRPMLFVRDPEDTDHRFGGMLWGFLQGPLIMTEPSWTAFRLRATVVGLS
jgi:hypothetical protein